MTTAREVVLATVSALGLTAVLFVMRTQRPTKPMFEGQNLTAWLRSAEAGAGMNR
jgi:hypothetical protein